MFAFLQTGPLLLESVRHEGFMITIDPDSLAAYLNETGVEFNLIYPGVGGQLSSVSLQLAGQPDMYLRATLDRVYMENCSHPPEPGMYADVTDSG